MVRKKTCSRCGQRRLFSLFRSRMQSRPGRILRTCLPCRDGMTNRFRRINPHVQRRPRRSYLERPCLDMKPYGCKAPYLDARNDYYANLRATVIQRLGGKCANCPFNDPRALHVDHVCHGGTAERRECTNRVRFLRRVLDAPPGKYQLLCANCNEIKEYERRQADKALRRARAA
jgi:hypothetical protein